MKNFIDSILHSERTKVALFTIIVFGLFFYFVPKVFTSDCNSAFNKIYRPMDIKGVVKSKYKDSTNHRIGTIFIVSNGHKQYMTLTGMDTTEIYDLVLPKDSIIKPQGSLTFRIIRNKNDIIIMDTTFELICKYKYISRWDNFWY